MNSKVQATWDGAFIRQHTNLSWNLAQDTGFPIGSDFAKSLSPKINSCFPHQRSFYGDHLRRNMKLFILYPRSTKKDLAGGHQPTAILRAPICRTQGIFPKALADNTSPLAENCPASKQNFCEQNPSLFLHRCRKGREKKTAAHSAMWEPACWAGEPLQPEGRESISPTAKIGVFLIPGKDFVLTVLSI